MQHREWLPTYTVKRHGRARHVKMSFSPTSGLQITVPPRFNLKHLPAILEENKEWIIKQSQRYVEQPVLTRPTDIHFQAFNESWTVHYFQQDKRPRVKTIIPNGLIVSGEISDLTVCLTKVSDWVRHEAEGKLISYFSRLAQEINLPYHEISVRSQSTLWGSCSHDKSIRLNYKLVFLPEALMRHIMIHELCHTRHMNHSDQFWQLVASFDEHWQSHKKAMKRADSYMPAWLQA